MVDPFEKPDVPVSTHDHSPARKTQVLHANALEERFRDYVPQPTDPDYADYCTWQALKLVEAQRMKRYDSSK